MHGAPEPPIINSIDIRELIKIIRYVMSRVLHNMEYDIFKNYNMGYDEYK